MTVEHEANPAEVSLRADELNRSFLLTSWGVTHTTIAIPKFALTLAGVAPPHDHFGGEFEFSGSNAPEYPRSIPRRWALSLTLGSSPRVNGLVDDVLLLLFEQFDEPSLVADEFSEQSVSAPSGSVRWFAALPAEGRPPACSEIYRDRA